MNNIKLPVISAGKQILDQEKHVADCASEQIAAQLTRLMNETMGPKMQIRKIRSYSVFYKEWYWFPKLFLNPEMYGIAPCFRWLNFEINWRKK